MHDHTARIHPSDLHPADGQVIAARLDGGGLCQAYRLVGGRVEPHAAPGPGEPHRPPLVVAAGDDFHRHDVVSSVYSTHGRVPSA